MVFARSFTANPDGLSDLLAFDVNTALGVLAPVGLALDLPVMVAGQCAFRAATIVGRKRGCGLALLLFNRRTSDLHESFHLPLIARRVEASVVVLNISEEDGVAASSLRTVETGQSVFAQTSVVR